MLYRNIPLPQKNKTQKSTSQENATMKKSKPPYLKYVKTIPLLERVGNSMQISPLRKMPLEKLPNNVLPPFKNNRQIRKLPLMKKIEKRIKKRSRPENRKKHNYTGFRLLGRRIFWRGNLLSNFGFHFLGGGFSRFFNSFGGSVNLIRQFFGGMYIF